MDQIFEVFIEKMEILENYPRCKVHSEVILSLTLYIDHKIDIKLITHELTTDDAAQTISKLLEFFLFRIDFNIKHFF